LRITGIKNLLNEILKTKKYMLNEKPDLILFSSAMFYNLRAVLIIISLKTILGSNSISFTL
jgi:hypothetical protein